MSKKLIKTGNRTVDKSKLISKITSTTFELHHYVADGLKNVEVRNVEGKKEGWDWEITITKIISDKGTSSLNSIQYVMSMGFNFFNLTNKCQVYGYMQLFLFEILNNHLLKYGRASITMPDQRTKGYLLAMENMISGLLLFQGGYETIEGILTDNLQYKGIRNPIKNTYLQINKLLDKLSHTKNDEKVMLNNCIGTYTLLRAVSKIPVDYHENVGEELLKVIEEWKRKPEEHSLSHLTVNDALEYLEDRGEEIWLNICEIDEALQSLKYLGENRRFTLDEAKRLIGLELKLKAKLVNE